MRMSSFSRYAASAIKDIPAYDLPLDLARHIRKAVENTGDRAVGAFALYQGLSHRQPTDTDGVWWDINEWRHLSYFTFMSILEGFGITSSSAVAGRSRRVYAVRNLDGDLLPEWAGLFAALDRYEVGK